MKKIDKKIKEMSKKFRVPDEYGQKVDQVLQSIPENDTDLPFQKRKTGTKGIVIFLCLFLVICTLFSQTQVVQAGFFETFKQTIMDFLGIKEENSQEMGIKSSKEKSIAKPDLMIELQEKVIDGNNIYLVVKITAPSDVHFEKNISFDYFAFSKGRNYNAENLLSGAKDCELLEVLEDKPNVATYVVSLSADEKLKEGSELIAFFKDLMVDPYGDNPKMLVEGMWSVNFTMEKTITDAKKVKGTKDMTYPFLRSTATLSKARLTPLGITVVSDISDAPQEELGVSDTTIALRLKMIDGSEKVVCSHDAEEDTIVESGSSLFYERKGKSFKKDVYQFQKTISVSRVMGIYVEDCYVPFWE